MFSRGNKSTFSIFAGVMLGVLIPQTTFADVFAPASCESLFSTNLVEEMSHEIDYRIDGLTANDSTKKIFSTRGNATDPWTRSATVWTMEGDTALDLTGASPWNSNSNFTKAGVLISPRHIIFAKHFPIANGSSVVFVADDNTIVTRTLQAQTSVVYQPDAGEDVQLGVLDSDVPLSIAFYPVVSRREMDRYLSEPRFPFLLLDQEAKASIQEIDYAIGLADEHVYFNYFAPAATSTRFAFYEGQVNGDSGQPGFFFVDGQPLLALSVTGAGYGPFYGSYIDAINGAIIELGNDGGYQVSTYDLSCFDVFNERPDVIDETFTIPENSIAGTYVGTTTASDTLGGDTLTYSILSGNTSNAFAIDSATGELTVATESAINFETHPSFELVIEAEDNWFAPTAATGTIVIELEDILEADGPTVTTVAASATEETSATLNGSITATGGQNPDLRGFVYGLSSSYGATTTEAGSFSTGDFSTTLTSLACGTTYYFKAWASNVLGGLSYGSERTVVTSACSSEEEGSGGGHHGGGGGGGGGSRGSAETTATGAFGSTLSPEVRTQLLIQLKTLIQNLIALGGTPSPNALAFLDFVPTPHASNSFTRDLDIGAVGADVTALQNFLITEYKGPKAAQLATLGASGVFGQTTQAALAEYQGVVGIVPASGYFGPKTRALVAATQS